MRKGKVDGGVVGLRETSICPKMLKDVCLESNVDTLARNSLPDAISFLPRPETVIDLL